MRPDYTYRLRPGYGSDKLLIAFDIAEDPDYFLFELMKLLSLSGFESHGKIDLWMNDEIIIDMHSPNGNIILSLNIWGMLFIMGNHNQKDILRINELLLATPGFKKEEVDYSEYQIPND